jgi:L-lactate dehydrogenase complex protein LldE
LVHVEEQWKGKNLMRVSLFITCVSDMFYPNVGKSVVALLEQQGVTVTFPAGQTCCGQPAFNTGYQDETKSAAKHMISVFENSEYVVSPSGSCVSMIRHFYPKLFESDDVWRLRVDILAGKTYEFSEFMINVLKVESLDASFEGIATYHQSCHMSRGIGVIDEPIKLLGMVNGLELRDLPYLEDCCGFGGTFAVKMHEISEKMVEEKTNHITSTGAQYLIGSDMACLMNIAGYMHRHNFPVKVYHVAELLYEGVKNSENQ